jgi:uncharacterized phage-associated protein
MSIPLKDAASFVCERGSWKVSNLALQKILYLGQMVHLGRNGTRLFDAGFEAWDYGPVIPQLYSMAKPFGDKPLPSLLFPRAQIRNAPEYRILEECSVYGLSKTPGQLVAMTHWDSGAWAKHYRPGIKGIKIPDSDIANEYRDRVAA